MRPPHKEDTSRDQNDVETYHPSTFSSTSDVLPTSEPHPEDSMRERIRHRKQTQEALLDENLFDPATLRDRTTLDIAITNLETCILNPNVDRSSIVTRLLGVGNLFGFAVSGE